MDKAKAAMRMEAFQVATSKLHWPRSRDEASTASGAWLASPSSDARRAAATREASSVSSGLRSAGGSRAVARTRKGRSDLLEDILVGKPYPKAPSNPKSQVPSPPSLPPVPLPLGSPGRWVLRDDFRGRKSFGFFNCNCGNWWTTAHAQKWFMQTCQQCDEESYALYMWQSKRPDYGTRENEAKCPEIPRHAKFRGLGGRT
eukprot:CAMPEP_0179030016 /NCGR_PEP_ID=MMETSP0796-20121207/10352_1 /TAXON_ID=73915 /ORGANISM="Pyrodinium bahamense, Strain pbaha01" /LENGTH=200 /DNA_ID=CAMNT_0020726193 /DNA_START=86 /DNA_END=687 /DNA_ORIENTATION=-